MNLQQLNGVGRSIDAFIGTALTALVLTGGSWWLMGQLTSLSAWRKRVVEVQRRQTRPKYTIAVRLAMLVWLLCNGHWSWMRKSGAGWHILTNSGSGFQNRYRYSAWVAASKGLTAGDFVSKFANEGIDGLKESLTISPFDIVGGKWID